MVRNGIQIKQLWEYLGNRESLWRNVKSGTLNAIEALCTDGMVTNITV